MPITFLPSRATNKNADLDGWSPVVNNSGTAFRNARLQLVAGELNRVAEGGLRTRMDTNAAVPMAKAAQQFQQESFSEYHLYSSAARPPSRTKETKQISLLQGSGVSRRKNFSWSTAKTTTTTISRLPARPLKDPVMVYYKFRNEERNGLASRFPPACPRLSERTQKGGILFAR